MGGGKEAAERDRGGGRGGAAAASAHCEARLAGALSEAKFTQQVVSNPSACSAPPVQFRVDRRCSVVVAAPPTL